MHIVFLTSEYPQPNVPHGGVGTFVQTIARELVKNNFRISIVGINRISRNEEVMDEGVKVFRLGKSNIKGLSGVLNFKKINHKLRNIHKDHPISIVESAEMGLAFINKIPDVKYLIRLHGGHHFFAQSENRGVHWWKAYQEKRSFKNADKIIGVSKYVVNHTSEYIDFETKKAGVIFNPANLDRFYLADVSKIIKGRVFFAGTICEKKGIRQLVQAMALVKKEIPQAHLIIAGREWFYPGTKKSYTDYLKTFIAKEMKDSIQFLGSLENFQIPAEIEKAEICCYPSHMEAMPLAWVEVMSMGKTFVTSNLGPGPELIVDGYTGILCNPLSPEDIAKNLIYAFKHEQIVQSMGLHAREFALQNFALSTILTKNISLYMQLFNDNQNTSISN